MPFINTKNLRIYYQSEGQGDNLLYISGTGGDLRKSPTPFDNNLKKSLTNFINFSSNESIKQCFKISVVYLILTALIFIILYLTDLRAFDSFNLSLTLISSGGFLPVNNLELIINTKLKEIILSLTMLFSFFSLFFSYNLIFFHKRNINFFSEDLYLGFI